MKRIKIFACVICLMFGICGCGEKESACSENTMHQLTNEIFNTKSQSCVENMIPIYYNNLEDKAKIRFDGLVNNISITGVKQTADNSFDVTLQVPDLENTVKAISKDTGFLTDKNTYELNGLDLEELYDKYLNSYLSQNACKFKEVTISAEVESDGADGWIIRSDVAFLPYLKNATEAVLVELVSENTTSEGEDVESESNEDTSVDLTSITEASAKGVFIVTQDNHRFLIDDISIKKNTDALNTIRQLSEINSNYDCKDTMVYVTYTATNISSSEGQINNGFVGVTDKGVVLQLDTTVGGLVSSERIASGETKSLTACVILRNGDSLYWYDTINALKITDY